MNRRQILKLGAVATGTFAFGGLRPVVAWPPRARPFPRWTVSC